MNINSSNIESQKNIQNTQGSANKQNVQSDDADFSKELKDLKKNVESEDETSKAVEENVLPDGTEKDTNVTKENEISGSKQEQESTDIKSEIENPIENGSITIKPEIEKSIEQVPEYDTKENINFFERDINKNQTDKTSDNSKNDSEEVIDQALENLSSIFQQLNKSEVSQKDEKNAVDIKIEDNSDDKNNEESNLINNDYNIKDKNQINPQMNPNMNFSGDGQPFSSFMGDSEQSKGAQNNIIGNSQKDLEEESKILSTMEENIEIANKNAQTIKKADSENRQVTDDTVAQQVQENELQEKTVNRNDGVKKVDVQSGVTIETVVKYDNIIMNEADVEVFVDLVQNNEVNINNLKPETATKAVHVSKTLADMLAKAQETNQPLRIDFDNDISVIIRISRDGKLSADFLPSSQVAEAYLKENLPLLKQRFDDNHIEYDELNQRNSRDKDRENNKRKERNNE